MGSINIRLEKPEDHRMVEELTREAFSNPNRIGDADFDYEHYIVYNLRKRDGIMDLNLVAEVDGQIVGHLIYADAHILQPDGTIVDVLNLGTLSVSPKFQLQGIGNALMNYSIEKAKKLGYGAILIDGHPEYYPRFGFVEAKEFGITTSSGDNFPFFMVLELKEGYLNNVSGKFIDSDLFDYDLHREQAEEFDRLFLFK